MKALMFGIKQILNCEMWVKMDSHELLCNNVYCQMSKVEKLIQKILNGSSYTMEPILNLSALAHLSGVNKHTLASKLRRGSKFNAEDSRKIKSVLNGVLLSAWVEVTAKHIDYKPKEVFPFVPKKTFFKDVLILV